MSMWPITKYALNSSAGEDFANPLDLLLGAKLVLAGIEGTTFIINDASGYLEEKLYEISNEDDVVFEGCYFRVIPIPLGTYNIHVSWASYETTVTVSVTELGNTYPVNYYVELTRFTANGNYTVPDNLTVLLFDACGGGGAGGGGFMAGGGGGGGATYILKELYNVTPGESLSITIGSGGAAKTGQNNGANGGSTIIGSLVTLAGGTGGKASTGYDNNVGAYSGGAGGTGKTSGGKGGTGYNSTKTLNTAGGTGGKAATDAAKAGSGTAGVNAGADGFGAGGGGGGSLGAGGKGGNGASSSSAQGGTGAAGGYGAGGGGGGGSGASTDYSGTSGKGGSGIVIIYTGVFLK